MRWKQVRPWFLGAGAVLIILTIASWPDLRLATTFFFIDLFVMLVAFVTKFAMDPRKAGPSSVSENPEPRDLVTGRLD